MGVIFPQIYTTFAEVMALSWYPYLPMHPPLDLTFFATLKNALNRECDLYLRTHGHEKITHYELAAIFDKVKVATMDKGISGFRTAGLWPFEPNKFSEDDFGPNKPSDSTAAEIPNVNIETPVDLISGSSETNQGLDVPIEILVQVPRSKTNQTNKPRAKQHSEIFTSTPLKSVLEKKQEKRNLKKEERKEWKEKG
ncbi:hypothetical protein HHI36_000249 [Cryptolaemus montrouzieri]|uniref:Uncharacterized protein n=1 Tax=Cryptolaemus montrouzieri TaxID=559131 RepID=A0ABD2P430_9CUCU